MPNTQRQFYIEIRKQEGMCIVDLVDLPYRLILVIDLRFVLYDNKTNFFLKYLQQLHIDLDSVWL